MEYHQDRFEDASLLVYKGQKLVALLPANKKGDTVYSHQGLTYGGLILGNKAKLTEVVAIFEAVLCSLKAKMFTSLILKQLPVFYGKQPAEELDYLAFVCKAKTIRVDTASVIAMRNRIPIQSNRTEGVKKAQKQGLIIKEETNFDAFWKEVLLPNLATRHDATPTHTLQEITALQKSFPKNIRQFNVYQNDVLKGGATIFETDTVAHVQYISAGPDKQTLGTLDLLFAHLINEVFADKQYFDFGISNEEGGTKLNVGLNYWKECFGARTYVHRFYEFNTSSANALETVVL